MKYFTVKEFAEKLRLCESSIRDSIKQGKIYALRPSMGKRAPFRIPETELERLQIMGNFIIKDKNGNGNS